MFTRRLVNAASKKSCELIKKAYDAHKSGLSASSQDTLWRYESMGQTLDCIFDSVKLGSLCEQAKVNLSQWAQRRDLPENSVEVVRADWGVATLQATRKYGKPYAVLNMANAVFPGGGALEGLSAQEENIWHRSTCAASLLDENVIFDESSQSFVYDEETTRMLEAKVEMSSAEHAILAKSCAEVAPVAYKAFFSRVPRVCFRGPEMRFSMLDGHVFTEAVFSSTLDKIHSYSFLPKEDIFPFYELRSAAPVVKARPFFSDREETKIEYKDELRRRIGSQLDTLILEGQRNVTLGAWGCGVFKNDPEIVAEVYTEEIAKRAGFFEHIIFAIINTGPYDKHAIFERQLNGIKLGPEASSSTTVSKFPR